MFYAFIYVEPTIDTMPRKNSKKVNFVYKNIIYLAYNWIASMQIDISVDFICIESTDKSVNADTCSFGAGFTNDLVGFTIINAENEETNRLILFYENENGKKFIVLSKI